MDEREITKNGPASAEPDVQPEPPRTCKICGGPNHYGCGCEAKAAREWPGKDAPPEMTEPTGPQPAEPTGPQPAEPHPTDAEIAHTIERSEKIFGHIEAMSDNVSDFCGNVLTVISYLSNIDQHLKEIHAMVKARIRQDADKNQN